MTNGLSKLMSLLAGAACLAAAAASPASAQYRDSRFGELILYDQPGFQGERRVYTAGVDDLSFEGFNDRASSVEVRGGAWQLCEARSLGGRCITVSRSDPDLSASGFNNVVSSFQPSQFSGGPTPGAGFGGITLFSGRDFTGEARGLRGDVSNLQFEGFNDRAVSIRVDGRSTWQICEASNFGGRCATIDRDVRDLAQLGLANVVSSVRRFDAGPGGGGGGGYGLTLYEGYRQSGRSVVVSNAVDNLEQLGFNDRTTSIATNGGRWEVCAAAFYQGRCEIVEGRIDDVAALGLAFQISSVRPAGSGGYPGGPGGGGSYGRTSQPDAVGRTSAFFVRPTVDGRAVPACDDGRYGERGRGRGASCQEAATDAFCRAAGYREGARYVLGRGREGYETLEEVLCIR
jgi:hypothetical protein